jgi:hypothetical protein
MDNQACAVDNMTSGKHHEYALQLHEYRRKNIPDVLPWEIVVG